MAAVNISLNPEFGYVVLVIVSSYFVIMYLGIRVGMARKKSGVKYPTMYSDKDQIFNCYQRAHQNTLENYPQFLALLLLGGLQYPCANAIAGAVYLFSRIVYAHGYYTGDPSKRNRGAFGYLGLLVMLGSSISFGLHLLGIL